MLTFLGISCYIEKLMNLEAVGHYISQARKAKKMTQAQLAAMVCYTPQAISLIEQGKSILLISTLYPLSAAIGLSPEDILSLSEETHPQIEPRTFDATTFAIKLKFHRKKRHITQTEAAEPLGVTRRTLRSYEKGKAIPNIEFVQAFLDFYKVELSDLERE